MNKNQVNYGHEKSAVGYATQAMKESHYLRIVAMVISIAVIAGIAYFGYSKYRSGRERTAQFELAQGIREYMHAFERTSTWPEVENLFKAGYERNKSADLAPYFEFFEVDSLLGQDKKLEAAALLDKALGVLSSKSPLYPMYATKRALLNIDMGNDVGIEQLTTLAHNVDNVQRDLSLYYLGLYYWSRNEIDAAQREWQMLLELKKPDQKVVSEWITLAEKKLEQIV